MGRPKLLLPWPTDELPDGMLIDAVLSAWTSSGVTEVVVVLRNDDEPLRLACERWPVTIVGALSPSDMKASVQVGLRHLQSHRHPMSVDRCFVAPADLPTLSSQCIDRLIRAATVADASSSNGAVVVPSFGERRGHPALLPWSITREIFELGDHEGVNTVVDRHRQVSVEFPSEQWVKDIDTPREYQIAIESATKRKS